MVAKSYRILSDIKSMFVGALDSLETMFKVPILAIFDDFWQLSSCLFWKPLT